MAAELKASTGSDAVLTVGDNGVFDVAIDGEVLFSKGKTGRFPEPGEISDLLQT